MARWYRIVSIGGPSDGSITLMDVRTKFGRIPKRIVAHGPGYHGDYVRGRYREDVHGYEFHWEPRELTASRRRKLNRAR